jgi:RimJ/RimL family protein N-acetyltransferase
MPTFRLRPIGPEDLDRLVELDADPEVMRHLTGGIATPRQAYVDEILPRWLGQASEPGLGFFALELDGDGFAGWLHLRRDVFDPGWAELGYRLRRSAWGRGLATTAARQLMARAFDELGFETVSARTVPENAASRRVMTKLGMRYAGDFTYPGRTLPGLTLPAMPGVLYVRDRASFPSST